MPSIYQCVELQRHKKKQTTYVGIKTYKKLNTIIFKIKYCVSPSRNLTGKFLEDADMKYVTRQRK